MTNKGLGRGLSALITQKPVNLQSGVAQIQQINSNIDKAPVDKLVPGEFQPRQIFKEDELYELADSIKKNGIFQPILVRKNNNNGYEIIAGERRWRASKICGLQEVPIIIMELEDKEALEIAIIENVQRQNLMALEEAEGYKRLIEEFKYTQEELSEVIGKSRSAIANNMRLLSLPNDIKNLIKNEKISAGHARALLGAKNAALIAESVMKKGLNVRQTEALVKKYTTNKTPKKPRDPEIAILEKEITKKIGYNISITNKGGKGKIIIDYSSLEALDTILHRLEG